MRRFVPMMLIPIASLVAGADVRPARAADEAALRLAKELTTKGAALFDTKDARAMADTYAEDAEIALVTRGDLGPSVKSYRGPIEIESLYADIFKGPEGIRSKNEVEGAWRVGPELLTIVGTFEVERDSKTVRLPFFQERVKQGDAWRISFLRIYAINP